jgi:hypothetical protein
LLRDLISSRNKRLSLALAGLLLAGSCSKKKEDPLSIAAPPPPGAASADELSTGIGIARGLDAGLAPTSTRWRNIFVLDDKRAILGGDLIGEAVLLMTSDGGKIWKSLRSEYEGWAKWATDSSGAIVLGSGAAKSPGEPASSPAGKSTPSTNRVLLRFASMDDPSLSAAATVLMPAPPVQRSAGTAATSIGQSPALLDKTTVAWIAEEAPRRSAVFYGAPAGTDPGPALRLPVGEQVLRVPFGRPPRMLSTRGRDLLIRPMPGPGKPVEAPQKVPGVVITPAVVTELSSSPACDWGDWSFQRITQPPARAHLLGISGARVVAFPLPEGTQNRTRVGCGANGIVVETFDAQANAASLSRCDLDGRCIPSSRAPFRSWPEPHEEEFVAVTTKQGAVAVMSSRSGDRWGLYLTQSVDGGQFYERPRAIGEGKGDRGRIELGALVSLGGRVVLLLSADVTGTSRRGWYVIVSDDGGTNWSAP